MVLEAAEGQKYGLDLRADRAVLSGFVLRGSLAPWACGARRATRSVG